MTIEYLKKIYEAKLDYNSFLTLKIIDNNALFQFKDFINSYIETITSLTILGYLVEDDKGVYSLTEKSKSLLKKVEEVQKSNEPNIKVYNKYEALHLKLQAELKKLTGKTQIKANGAYPFLCNACDLENKLSKVVKKYKLDNWEIIETCLINHIKKAYNQRFEKIQLIQYYISKDSTSTLASDYEAFDGETKEIFNKPSETFDI